MSRADPNSSSGNVVYDGHFIPSSAQIDSFLSEYYAGRGAGRQNSLLMGLLMGNIAAEWQAAHSYIYARAAAIGTRIFITGFEVAGYVKTIANATGWAAAISIIIEAPVANKDEFIPGQPYHPDFLAANAESALNVKGLNNNHPRVSYDPGRIGPLKNAYGVGKGLSSGDPFKDGDDFWKRPPDWKNKSFYGKSLWFIKKATYLWFSGGGAGI